MERIKSSAYNKRLKYQVDGIHKTGGLKQHYINLQRKIKRQERVLQAATHLCIYVKTWGHYRWIFKYKDILKPSNTPTLIQYNFINM